MDRDDDQHAWLILLRTPGLGSARLRELLRQAGDIHAALARARATDAGRIGPRAADWLRAPDPKRIEADVAWLSRSGHRLLRCTDADFPPQLEAMPDPPAALFVAGNTALLLRPQVAIVGARHASPDGCRHAAGFARALGAAGLIVTSGLAEGIDAAAHEAALAASTGTVAVVGTGPDRVYPGKHAGLSRSIVEQGALVSEFPPGTGARPGHFPRRNRIIAGLSLGTLVIEAGLRSGSLITARLAADAGREVFAVPGSIRNPLARGCHRLIRDGASLAEGVDDLLPLLAPLARAQGVELAARLEAEPTSPPPAAQQPADALCRRLLDAIGHDPVTLDEVCQRSGLEAAQVSPRLLMLELDGMLASQPGGRYQRFGKDP